MSIACAVGLLMVAAAGLSAPVESDYCGAHAHATISVNGTRLVRREPAVSRELALWPPGQRCVYAYADGRLTIRSIGSVAAFVMLLAAGLVAVVRRNRFSWATLLMLAVAGAGCLVRGIDTVIAAVPIGIAVTFALTRSASATTTAAGVLVFGCLINFAGGSALGWAALLLLVPFADLWPQRRRAPRLGPAPSRSAPPAPG